MMLSILAEPLSQCCALPAPLSGEPYFSYLFVMEIPVENIPPECFQNMVQQAGHRAERSCSLRPRKAAAFLTHLPRAPEAWRREFRCLRTAT